MHPSVTAILSAALSAAITLPAPAGPLDPPPGPVTSTMKPLDQVEPRTAIGATTTPGDADSLFRITQAGSYYLTGNILGLSGKAGIEITVSDVTIDLMGFEMKGAAGSLDGVKSVGNLGNITIRNGTVAIWRQDGIDLATASDSLIEEVRLAFNFDVGARIGGSSVVTTVTAPGSPNGGIVAGYAASISNCIVSGGSGPGITAGNGSTISGCVSQGNVDDGFVLAAGCTVTACTADDNSGMGFRAGAGSSIVNSSARSNSKAGFELGDGAVITGCTATGNTLFGMRVINGGTFSACIARDNGDDGIVAGNECNVTGCSATSNDGQGFYLGENNRITGCTAASNSQAGIYANKGGNTIDGNSIVKNERGVFVQWPDNFIVRNSASDNTIKGYDFMGFGQTNGPIVGSGQIASNSPWANFDF
jgi:parallel beta-helix repeat protein